MMRRPQWLQRNKFVTGRYERKKTVRFFWKRVLCLYIGMLYLLKLSLYTTPLSLITCCYG